MYFQGVNYIKQREDDTCVSCAIINALKWSGSKNANGKHVKEIHKLIWQNHDVTKITNIVTALKKCKKYFSFKYKKYPTLKFIKKSLEDTNKCMLFSFFRSNENKAIEVGHCILIFKYEDKVAVINDGKLTCQINTWQEFKQKYMKKTECYPDAFILCKSTT